jgi:hypothetical protein
VLWNGQGLQLSCWVRVFILVCLTCSTLFDVLNHIFLEPLPRESFSHLPVRLVDPLMSCHWRVMARLQYLGLEGQSRHQEDSVLVVDEVINNLEIFILDLSVQQLARKLIVCILHHQLVLPVNYYPCYGKDGWPLG